MIGQTAFLMRLLLFLDGMGSREGQGGASGSSASCHEFVSCLGFSSHLARNVRRRMAVLGGEMEKDGKELCVKVGRKGNS